MIVTPPSATGGDGDGGGGTGIVDDRRRSMMPRVLALYFPQYHKDPINDENWGINFTDWISLLASPRKNREGYDIPRPTELGYYDLSDVHPRKIQGDLANMYGIDGFVYHHYWFYDVTRPGPTLATPLLKMLDDGHPNVPFFLNWCALRWVNAWMGNARNVTPPKDCVGPRSGTRVRCPPVTLQEQYFDPSTDDIATHYVWLSKFFHHANYIRIANQPVMLLYHYDVRAVRIVEELRRHAMNDGFDGIYWIVGRKAAPDGIYDMTREHPSLVDIIREQTQTLDALPLGGDHVFNQSMTYPYPLKWVNTYEVPEWCIRGGRLREEAIPNSRQEVTGILTAFDNTPRRHYDEATIYGADMPSKVLARFKTNLRAALYYAACCQRRTEDDDQFVAINAWNEWGEGMAIEPSDTYGRGFLEIIREVKDELREGGCVYE
jgi:hypothetical protein